ncbi:branched-chain amino acid ABC transporter permease [Ferrimonas balearica]|uniref:branched-chain amino acid ABC transporter permease n=1 Tax=Ferrimonas balearica TaxID=44012 RepID=UPI001C56935A|nr:branched-chain amino acid ABC transporter permease [Ferrimonas balearica]MBW3139781.1 branched-chain amino acid ABC transporter permease [Ferrimonas balearica]MBW3164805.1 branched-chain amino acid ABC transporter permease [Ferrimonas balearica]MBY5980331.1 branched-chain amino acid ABC transporter permease [Ferrimonas balearica]MBY6107113.1 branched-chain amino acid ABC transporter permease [Ferrimonas balearica]
MNVELLLQLVINGLIVGLLYGVVGMCFVLVYKSTQIVNFAQGEFLLVGAWVCWALLVYLELPFLVGFLLSLAFMAVFGVALQMIVLRPMIGEPIISVIMVTIGLSIFFQSLVKWIFGVAPANYPPIFETQSVSIFGLNIELAYLLSTVIALFIMVGFYLFFKHSKHGLAMRATAFNQQVAQSLGISVKQVFAMSWGIAATVSATAGVVIGMVNGVSDSLSVMGIKVFPAVILGGLDSIVGAIVGGIIIGVLENLAEFFDSQYFHLGNMYDIAPFYVLLLILWFKPYGLFGTRDIERI